MGRTQKASITDLPDEVIQAILYHVPATTTLSLQRTCRRFAHVANEHLLWKFYCQGTFKWWDGRHDLTAKLVDPSFIEWKKLYAERYQASQATRHAVDEIVAQEVGRLDKIQTILEIGYDAKDVLLDAFLNASTSPNHLAQRYWSHAALGCLHRLLAVQEWTALKSTAEINTSYEKPLAALDLFILEEQREGDIDDIFARLDSYVSSVRSAHPDIDVLSPRQKARLIAEHLLQHNWVGIQGGRHYHSLDHMFLGVSLFSSNRNSVPLISCVTYCYVARQFNLRAAPCSYPFHVNALVQPPPGIDLDGNILSPAQPGDAGESERSRLYMDPFNTSEPTSYSTLQTQLRFIVPTSTPARTISYLSPASPRDLTIRAAHNILSVPSHYVGPSVEPISLNLAIYAALFCLVLLPDTTAVDAVELRQRLVELTQHFLEHYDLDVYLFEKYVLPLTASLPDSRAYRNLIHQLRESDSEPRRPKYRSMDPSNRTVKYEVGQVFRHRRRGYLAVIYGWDPYCRMQEQWIMLNRVDRLPNGRHQPFYNVLVEDDSTRYVAEENVVLLSPSEITEDVWQWFPIAIGKWFKRFDMEAGVFVSNVKDEYPED